ncbi:MAG: biotin--[acetyl-CoA-carboxylase] ligase [Dehalococcoidia bacterium]
MPGNVVSLTLRGGLFTRVVGKRILFFQKLSSTMDEAVLQAEAGAEEGTVVVAETQTASRGRFGRTWVSAEGNLYLSVLFYPTLKALPFLSSLGGVAVVRAINQITGLKPRIKWPNDVLLDGKKVAGILVESAIAGDSVRYAVLGIGINVSREISEIDELSSFVTSLNGTSAGDISREELLRELLQQLDALFLELRQGQAPLQEWQSLMDTLGRRVQVTWQGESYVGLAEGLDQAGNLQLRLDDGRLMTMAAGDVSLR